MVGMSLKGKNCTGKEDKERGNGDQARFFLVPLYAIRPGNGLVAVLFR